MISKRDKDLKAVMGKRRSERRSRKEKNREQLSQLLGLCALVLVGRVRNVILLFSCGKCANNICSRNSVQDFESILWYSATDSILS